MAAPETGAPGTALETAAQAQEQEQSTAIFTDLDAGRKRLASGHFSLVALNQAKAPLGYPRPLGKLLL